MAYDKSTKGRFKITLNAPFMLAFTAVCLIATILNQITAGKSNEWLFMTYHSSLKQPLTYIRFFTHVFGHSGWAHFMGNASYLLLLGPMLEEKYGAGKLAGTFAITAAVTGILNYIFFPSVALCGASGVVFACIMLTSFTSFKEREIPITFILVAVIFIGGQIMDGLFTRDNISQLSHIIGGIVGGIVGYNLNRRS
ncbi:MAG: rhomboid family intramembrane serine protease [Lachnospiraceae bacterium]|nr:rhomboid family intramembrane serine protease [Lachnospiraceae bacterium]MBR1567639.1 rhomboid family intramembrane serine protease [Lachnospiraceae bacterium]